MKKYEPVMRITTQAEADAYFEKLVADSMVAHGLDREQAEKLERMNIGYEADYYRSEIRIRGEELVRCEHPVLGKAKDFNWTQEELLAIGYTLGGLMREDLPEHEKDARG
jgi:hypothetical protein